jgi:MFS family permease
MDVTDQLSAGRRRAVLAIAIGAIALDTALLGLIAPLLPQIESRTGSGEAGLGLALAAYSIPIFFVSLPLGRLADRAGRRPLLLGGLLLTAAGSAVIALSSALEPLIAGRAIQGVGSAASWIAALALVSDLAPEGRKGEAIGFALAANSVGAIGGPALGGLTADALGFEFPFVLVGSLAVGLAVAGFALLPRQRPREAGGGGGWRPMFERLSRPDVRPAVVIVVGGSAALGLIEVAAPLDADERLGLSAAAIGGLFAATIALDAIAAPLAGRASDARGRRPVAAAGLAALSVSAVLLAVLPGTVGLGVGLGVFGVGTSIAFAAALPWLDEAFGNLDRGFGYGVLNVLYSAGYSVGPLIAGVTLELGDAELVYWGLAVLAAGLAASTARRRTAPA